jgi:ferredoxin
VSKTLRVDPIACDGHGLCAELFPEWIHLDDWGFPIVDGRPVPPGLEDHARRAVAECPVVALKLAAAANARVRARR